MSDSGMGQLQDYTVDQLAGAIALTLGALGSLLLVIWQSRCLCRCRIGISDECFCFDCERQPPSVDPENPEDSNEESLVPPKPGDSNKKSTTDQPKVEAEPEPEISA